MPSQKFTNLYLTGLAENGNYGALKRVIKRPNAPSADLGKKTVSLLRSLPGYGPDAIPGRSSSLLPPSFASGRFAAFLSSGGQA
jgi:hypothetical protein